MHRETIKKLNETITSLCDYIQDLIERNPAGRCHWCIAEPG
ncbi:hypothetical protein P7H15_26110 [Paenibacillus larvae]|nr:hypothetical protein [Paenibacillus larvae]MDT2295597.1 hypothetical protein [Paenibacillus larvae]